MTAEFLSAASFVLILIILFFVIKIYKEKNSQATGNETAFLEDARANPRALPLARDHVIQYFPYTQGSSDQRGMWNGRILGGTPAITRLPRHHDESVQ